MRAHGLLVLLLAGCATKDGPSLVDDDLSLDDTGDTDVVDTDARDTDVVDTDVLADTDDTDGTDTAVLGVGLPAFCPTPTGGAPAAPRAIATATGTTADVVDGLSTFDFRLFAQLPASTNTVISPLSISVALAMTWEGAGGSTQSELATALGIPTPADDWRTALVDLLADVEGTSQEDGAFVSLANNLFGDSTFLWRQDFTDRCRDDWDAPFRPLTFAPDPDPARLQINDWVRRQTCGMIPTLLPPGALSPATALMLVNALFVEADWRTTFDANNTADDTFHLADGTTRTLPFMQADVAIASTRPGAFTVAQLPLQGGELGFWVVVPDAADGLPAIEASWSASDFATWTAAATSGRVELHFPKYQQATSTDMVPGLQALGVSTVFDPAHADLSGMADTTARQLWVSQVAHSAVIAFDEQGLRAAAATAVAVEADTGGLPPPELRVDRPFLFVLRDELTGLILFMGRTTDPTAG